MPQSVQPNGPAKEEARTSDNAVAQRCSTTDPDGRQSPTERAKRSVQPLRIVVDRNNAPASVLVGGKQKAPGVGGALSGVKVEKPAAVMIRFRRL
jgi:hypothetical protein